MARLDFWYEFASTYSYLAAMRIEGLAEAAGVTVRWRPFLLGPIFARQGWNTSPFNIYPTKGAYMWRDMDRLCQAAGLPLICPDPFPQNGLLAARVATVAAARGWVAELSKAVYSAEFGRGEVIEDRAVVAAIVRGLGHDADEVLAAAVMPDIKEKLRAETDRAASLGIFGAPSFVAEDGELFWGNDRLEQALDWARTAA